MSEEEQSNEQREQRSRRVSTDDRADAGLLALAFDRSCCRGLLAFDRSIPSVDLFSLTLGHDGDALGVDGAQVGVCTRRGAQREKKT